MYTIKLLFVLISVTYVSVSFGSNGYGDLRITGGGSYGTLEFKQRDGQWGTVCNRGFDTDAADVACRQLGYDYGHYSTGNSYANSPPIAVCEISCTGYEHRLTDCTIIQSCEHDYNYCTHNKDVTVSCYHHSNDYNEDDSSTSSSGAVIGLVVAGVFIVVVMIFLFVCRLIIRYSYIRRNQNRTVIVAQRRTPNILIARVTRTVSSHPPPPPAYTPSAPNDGYAPVPPRGYQPVPTTDYAPANAASNPPVACDDNIPSDPPPEYTPAVSSQVAFPVAEDSTQ